MTVIFGGVDGNGIVSHVKVFSATDVVVELAVVVVVDADVVVVVAPVVVVVPPVVVVVDPVVVVVVTASV